jgi:hypothetical protein
MAPKRKKLPIGKKFNKLTLLIEVHNTRQDKRRYVYVLCDCGSKKTVRYDSVQSGRVKSCGCLASKQAKNRIRKMQLKSARVRQKTNLLGSLGKKYNKLTILSVYKHPKQKCSWVKVQCDCGKIFNANLGRVKAGRTKSCGCIIYDNAIKFISEIDGEILYVFPCSAYYRTDKPNRLLLHAYEANKLLIKMGQLCVDFFVHHIDGNGQNNKLSNLALFPNNASHVVYHTKFEKAAFKFLLKNNLLDTFYEKHPNLKPKTLEETFNEWRTKEYKNVSFFTD